MTLLQLYQQNGTNLVRHSRPEPSAPKPPSDTRMSIFQPSQSYRLYYTGPLLEIRL